MRQAISPIELRKALTSVSGSVFVAPRRLHEKKPLTYTNEKCVVGKGEKGKVEKKE